jgi:hypothetical protein
MEVNDRRLEILLERLDTLNAEVAAIGKRLDRLEALEVLVAEMHSLSQSLQTLALAAMGTRGPNVRRNQ